KAIPAATRCCVSADNATGQPRNLRPGSRRNHPMSHQSAPPQPPRIPRTLAGLGTLAVCLAAAIGLAPAARATPSPPTSSLAPVPPLPPPAAVPAHFPPWAIAAILAATIVLSVATTLITLALE